MFGAYDRIRHRRRGCCRAGTVSAPSVQVLPAAQPGRLLPLRVPRPGGRRPCCYPGSAGCPPP